VAVWNFRLRFEPSDTSTKIPTTRQRFCATCRPQKRERYFVLCKNFLGKIGQSRHGIFFLNCHF
jgi:hypothetical protein